MPLLSSAPRALLLVALALALGTGCVSKRKYNEQAAVLDKTREALRDRKAESEALMASLDAEERRTATLGAEADKLREDVARLMSEKGQLTDSVMDMSRALAELAARKKAADDRIAEYKSLLARFAGMVESGKLRVKVVDGRLVVEMATDILFGSGKAALSPQGKQAVMEVGAILATLGDRRFQVEGHTDDVPIKSATFPSNWELSSARAITVLKALIEGGMAPGNVSAAAFGDSRPTVPNTNVDARARNRRIEIVLVPDLSTLPGFDELNSLSAPKP
ncbi:MAG: OmpA family protein [Deltaproteobacteria bacterium]|nr:OmpA family protein [Deltaproteobacteria bacterium]